MTNRDIDGHVVFGRRNLIRIVVAAASLGEPARRDHKGPTLELWLRWQAARRHLDQLSEEERTLGVGERQLDLLTDMLINSDARTVADLIIKLTALLALAPIRCGDANDYPWPEIRRVIDTYRSDR